MRIPIYLLLLVTTCATFAQTKSSIPEVQALLDKMTIEEKIGQLNLLTPGGGVLTGSVVSKNVEDKIKAGNVGGLFGVSGPEKLKIAQDIAMKQTRLKIPLFFGSDVIHGYKTTFPIPLGMASSWDMAMLKKSAQIAALESTADGINWNFSPMVDIARDPRWGRISEGAGEDPFLGSAIAKAMVEGYQGTDLTHPETMLATVKHFALYGAVEAGRDYNSVDMGRVKMYNEYLPPYKAAIDANVASVMSSFNDVDGIPATGNTWLLTDLLREQWGFKGFVVSDYTSVNEMIAHGSGDLQAVSAQSLKAGLDMDMVGEGFLTTLKKSLEAGKVTEDQITQACLRVLEAKHKLGLFKDPYRYIDAKRPKKDILRPESRKFARELAARSFVLLKNDQNILPIKRTGKIALIGPLANDQTNMLGTWAPTGDFKLSIPVMAGFKNSAPEAQITYAKGANIVNDTAYAKKVNVFGTKVDIDPRTPEAMLWEAVELAKASDVVIAVVGETAEMTGEAASRTDLSIPEPQMKLIRALVATGKPVALVLMSGRPLTIEEVSNMPVSILQVWHPGVEAGNAVADVVFGDVNPSGKLTATWPRNVGQIPIYYSIKNTGRPAPTVDFAKFKSNYLDTPNSPLYAFGYGLSYTTFEYKDLKIDKKEIGANEPVEVSVTVSNTGDRDGEEVVQLYLHDVVRSITPPLRMLKGFQKVMLKKGESKTVTIILKPEDLKFYNSTLEFVAEPGDFEVYVGGNSNAQLMESFKLKE